MADAKVSPEEKLFNIIQKNEKEPLAPTPAPTLLRRRMPVSIPKIKALFSQANLKPFAAFSMKRLGELEPRVINKVLIAALGAITVIVVHSAVNRRQDIAAITKAVSQTQGPAVMEKKVDTFKPVSFYLDTAKKRDIFTPVQQIEKKIAYQTKPILDKLKDLAANLILKGIAWGDIPKVMIGNKEEGKVYFLKEGQIIGATGIEVKTILRNKVVISYEGEELELL